MKIKDFRFDCIVYDGKYNIEFATIKVKKSPWSKWEDVQIYKNITYWKFLDSGEFVDNTENLSQQVEALQMKQLYDKHSTTIEG
jgi:hypothetical protein